MSELKVIDEISECERPLWLISTFFDRIVEKKFNLSSGKYQSSIVSVTPVVGNSENHRTIICRVNLEIIKTDCDELINFSTIVKALLCTMPEYEEIGIFPREMNMYEMILPKLEAQWKLHEENIKFAPICYATEINPTRIIVLEDLSVLDNEGLNYEIKSQAMGLDMVHSKLVLEKLAKFHASSAVCYSEKCTEYNRMLYSGVLHEEMRPVIELGRYTYIASFMQIFEHHEMLRPYINKIRNWFEIPFEHLAYTLNPNPDELNVINHCDCWTNNLLFACDSSQKPQDVILVDYQTCAFGSPVLDLYTFIITSVTDEIKANHLDELIEYYYTQLTKNLSRLNYIQNVPTWKEFRRIMQQKSIWAASSLTTILPLVMLESDEKVSIEIFFRTDEEALNFRYRAYNNPKYLDSVVILLKFLDKQDSMCFEG